MVHRRRISSPPTTSAKRARSLAASRRTLPPHSFLHLPNSQPMKLNPPLTGILPSHDEMAPLHAQTYPLEPERRTMRAACPAADALETQLFDLLERSYRRLSHSGGFVTREAVLESRTIVMLAQRSISFRGTAKVEQADVERVLKWRHSISGTMMPKVLVVIETWRVALQAETIAGKDAESAVGAGMEDIEMKGVELGVEPGDCRIHFRRRREDSLDAECKKRRLA